MILNVMEHHVTEAYDRLKLHVPGFEDSAAHREDVVVYALNRLPPKYVVTDEGKAVTEATLHAPQHRASIEIQVMAALQQVTREPRLDRRASSSG
jgi:competence protein ComFB